MLIWWICWAVGSVDWLVVRAVVDDEDDWSNAQQQWPSVDEHTKLVIFGNVHGDRYPPRFIDGNARTWGYEGAQELTQFGKRQGFSFGKQLREFVRSFVNNNYLSSQAAFYTSAAHHSQMTLQVIMAGLYPPETFAEWNHALEWSPVPYTIDDQMLKVDASINCSFVQNAWRPILEDNLPKLYEMATNNQRLLDYIANETGWNASISAASDLADNLLKIELHHAKLPLWLKQPNLEGYDERSLKQALEAFSNVHEQTCAEYKPCREVVAGNWLLNLLRLMDMSNNKNSTLKLIGYVTNLETMLSLMRLMQLEVNDLETCAGFILEYRDEPEKSIRILVHKPHNFDIHIIVNANYSSDLMNASDSDHWISMDVFIQAVNASAIRDWHTMCTLPEATCDSTNNQTNNEDDIHSSVPTLLQSSSPSIRLLYAAVLCSLLFIHSLIVQY